MTEPSTGLSERAAELRREFDAAFSRPYTPEAPPQVDLLVIGVADRSYALRLADVRELLADRAPVPVPSHRADLLGLLGLRGVVTPVYDLALQLAHPRADQPRWIVEARSPAPFALAFERFERHVRLPLSALAPVVSAEAGAFVRFSAKLPPYPLPVIDLPAIFQSVTKRRPAPERAEE